MKGSYYSSRLSAKRLRRCYDIAPPSVRRYLQAEIDFVAAHLRPDFLVLELGCGYGRVIRELASSIHFIVGIDISIPSIGMAHEELMPYRNARLIVGDASNPCFKCGRFDLIYCIQNGISAFHADKRRLMESTVQLLKPGGLALFSSYACQFWEHRLEWFKLQAGEGLIGPINENATGDGVIVCTDGFEAHTVGPDEFDYLTRNLEIETEFTIVDNSSLFCGIRRS